MQLESSRSLGKIVINKLVVRSLVDLETSFSMILFSEVFLAVRCRSCSIDFEEDNILTSTLVQYYLFYAPLSATTQVSWPS